MAKTKGPLFSLEAHGSIKKTISYSSRKSGSMARNYNKPTRTPSHKQRGRRRIVEFLVAQWQAMSDATKDTWRDNAEGKRLGITGYQYFLKAAQADLYGVTGLVCYYPMNEIINNQVVDFSGNDLNGDLEPTPPSDAPQIIKSFSKKFDNGLEFDGISHVVNLGQPTKLNITDEITIDLWIKRGRRGYFEGLIGTGNVLDMFGMYLRTETDADLMFSFNPDGTSRKAVGGNIATGEIAHITCTFKDATPRIYINGLEIETFIDGTVGARTVGDIFIGRSGWTVTPYFFQGTIDEVCVYNKEMSAIEILKRHNFAINNVKK